MILYYVRHGDPIYDPNSLTPLGQRQAEALAKRFGVHGLDRIYSSPSNRALQTAQPTCEILKKKPILVDFAVQLWMYATPIVYPLSMLGDGWMRTVLLINPVTAPVEVFRYAVLGQGTIMPGVLALSWGITIAVLMIGIIIFNKVEKTFMDTV